MNNERAKKLKELFRAGYSIKIVGHGYVDSFVDFIGEYSPATDPYGTTRSDAERPETGELVYDSEVFSQRPLREVPADYVSVYRNVTDEVFTD